MKTEQKSPTHSVKEKKQKFTQVLPMINSLACGIDVGSTFHAVAISNGKGGHEVKEYKSFTADLNQLVGWLKESGITTVAMESTGIYWLNLYLLLEEAGIEPYLVNAKHVKNVTGRKKDDTDAIWLQKLHSCGLLQKSFQPEGDIRELRTYVRQRKNLIRQSSDSVRRMQKALELMNIKIHVVISDILGKTGLAMVESILQGEREPEELIKLKDPRIKANDEDIKKSLEGIWKERFLFLLEQAYEQYRFYQTQMQACEQKIMAQLLNGAAKVLEGDITELDLKKKGKIKKNQFSFNAQKLLEVIIGVDICKVDGISEVSAVELISEIGTDMHKWKSSKHFSAWLNVVPNTKITGGRIISSKVVKKKNQAGQTLRMSASSLHHSKAPLGDYSRKMKSKLGKKGGVVATAHKLAKIIYTMIKNKEPYSQSITADDQQKWKEQRIKYLERRLTQLKCAS